MVKPLVDWITTPKIITPGGKSRTHFENVRRVAGVRIGTKDLITIIGMDRQRFRSGISRLVWLTVICASVTATSARSASAPATEQFSEAVVTELVDRVRQGLETANQDEFFSAFDPERMQDYPVFRDQIRVLLENYESLRVAYNIRQVWTDGPTGVAIVDFEMEAVPQAGDAPPRRTSGQLRFEFARSTKGWKIVALSPREFFS